MRLHCHGEMHVRVVVAALSGLLHGVRVYVCVSACKCVRAHEVVCARVHVYAWMCGGLGVCVVCVVRACRCSCVSGVYLMVWLCMCMCACVRACLSVRV